jgi:NADH-quinone oxidoreductase subunit N
MNYSLTILETAVIAFGLALLLLDLWTPAEQKRQLGYGAAAALGLVFVFSFTSFVDPGAPATAFNGMFVQDALALFFKRFFLLAAIIVLIMSVEFADRIPAGISEYYALILFALSGMMFAASANDFSLLFVAVELITVTFYVLTSFQRSRRASLEAGVKYLILGALSSAFLVFGIALVWGTTGTFNFTEIGNSSAREAGALFKLGLLLVLAGLGFKIAAFPLQIWAPDVYQGSPTPTTAFLAVGSKAAGFVLLLRVLFTAVPDITAHWTKLLIVISGVTILYGNLCAIPQRNLKRLLGYSSISNAGYLLLGVAALSHAGQSGVLYYLAGYLFTVLAAFMVICLVMRQVENEDISALAGLNRRSPLLAITMTLAMVSLAGIPPLAGFFGKFLLLKAVVEQGASNPAYYWLAAIAVVGVVISLYYYFGVVRTIYWSNDTADLPAIQISAPVKAVLLACIGGMLYLGLFPGLAVDSTSQAVATLKTPTTAASSGNAPSVVRK